MTRLRAPTHRKKVGLPPVLGTPEAGENYRVKRRKLKL
jgi:hypothetical protein